jgi:hypothetical protein
MGQRRHGREGRLERPKACLASSHLVLRLISSSGSHLCIAEQGIGSVSLAGWHLAHEMSASFLPPYPGIICRTLEAPLLLFEATARCFLRKATLCLIEIRYDTHTPHSLESARFITSGLDVL